MSQKPQPHLTGGQVKSFVHFIGICGVGMGALAIMMKKKGYRVTGSDVGFYPPISTHLKEHGIEYYAGWHTKKMGTPDLVVVGNVASSENPEWQFVQENKIPFVSYPELVARELVRKNSIVCAGTYGKTSTSALLSWILINAGLKPAYMFGGLSQTPALASDDLGGKWSVLEGDEYKTARWDNGPKFSHYSPTHLLLTAVQWDHADVYPTEESYFEAFEKLIASIPKDGLLVVSEQAISVIPVKLVLDPDRGTKISDPKGQIPASAGMTNKIVTYGQSPKCDYRYSDVVQTKNGLEFDIHLIPNTYHLKTNLIGDFQAENICGAFALACAIGIAPKKIIASIKSFHGIKRRLEKRGTTKTGAAVIDDIAHSPAKAKSVLETLKQTYKPVIPVKLVLDPDRGTKISDLKRQIPASAGMTNGKIYCVFEPNSGNRKFETQTGYDHAFDNADEIIIPRLTKLKNDAEFMSGAQLTEIIQKTNPNAKYIDSDDELVRYLQQKTRTSDVVVFCGSHGFRGMIEELIRRQILRFAQDDNSIISLRQ